MKKIKVLIIEDSILMKKVLYEILSSDSDIRVIAVEDDPLKARDLIKKLNPDVITLDIMLPHMDGITFLKNLMHFHPVPVIIISSIAHKNNKVAIEALASGAIDCLPKPTNKDFYDLTNYSKNLVSSIKEAAQAHVKKSEKEPMTDPESFKSFLYDSEELKKQLIVIGASTGGIEAIEAILMQLPKVMPPIAIVQHIRKEFSASFSRRIRKLYGLTSIDLEDSTEVLPGNIYISPGNYHLVINKQAFRYCAKLVDSPPLNGHKPSVDVLFESAAKAAGSKCIGILLTGMGIDGAEGLKKIREAGGITLIQDQDTSVIWGMPGSAFRMNVVDYVVPLNKIPKKLLEIIDDQIRKGRIKK